MELGMIELGRMGTDMVRRLLRPVTSASFTTSIRKLYRRWSKGGGRDDIARRLRA